MDNTQFTDKMRIAQILTAFNVGYEYITEHDGRTVTLYEVKPRIGVRISKIRNLKDEIAAGLEVSSVRIIAPMENGCVGIEVPNRMRSIIPADEIFSSQAFKSTRAILPLAMGRTVTNDIFIADLADMPHLLVAGATGQGKSVGLNVMLLSLLKKKTPEELKLVLIDPKKVEFSAYDAIARPYITRLDGFPAIITEAHHANAMLDGLCKLMEKRYTQLNEIGARNIVEYNYAKDEKMQYYVIVIDEFGDLVMDKQFGKSIEYSLCRLAQKARAVGMHLIISTQRPDTKVITGNIKANFPTRIAFRTTTGVDSRVILDRLGAEKLLGKGDMLYFSGASVVRAQCAYVCTEQVVNTCCTLGDFYKDRKEKVLRVINSNDIYQDCPWGEYLREVHWMGAR